MGVKWTSDVQMQYRLPKQKEKLVLKKDKDILRKLTQPEQVSTQFCMLEEEVMEISFSIMVCILQYSSTRGTHLFIKEFIVKILENILLMNHRPVYIAISM